MSRRTNDSQKNKKKSHQEPLISDGDLSWAKFNITLQQFLKYGWEILGVLLIALGLILFLAFIGITSGAVVDFLDQKFTEWIGIGRYLFAASVIAIGFQVVRWRKQPPQKIELMRILAFAWFVLALFISLPLFNRRVRS